MVDLASIVGFLVALLVSTMLIYVVTKLSGDREGFGREFLAALIIWQTTSSYDEPSNFRNRTDYIFCYDKSDKFTWHEHYSFRG